jgi:hypothetical protein
VHIAILAHGSFHALDPALELLRCRQDFAGFSNDSDSNAAHVAMPRERVCLCLTHEMGWLKTGGKGYSMSPDNRLFTRTRSVTIIRWSVIIIGLFTLLSTQNARPNLCRSASHGAMLGIQ